MTPCTKCGRPCTYDNWICDYCKGEEKDPLYDEDDADDMDWDEEDSDEDYEP